MNYTRNEPTSTTFTVRDFNTKELDGFVKTLNAVGIEAVVQFGKRDPKTGEAKTATLSVAYPYHFDAERARTRNAGRKHAPISYDAEIKFDTVRAFLEWYDDGHTVAEGMAELGQTRSTFLRTVKRMREKVQERDQLNASRVKSGRYQPLPELKLRDFH